MEKRSSCYFSEMLGCSIYDGNNILLGKLSEVIVTTDAHLPEIQGIVIRTSEGLKNITFKLMEIYQDRKLRIVLREYKECRNINDYYSLSMDILDKQIVDINGRRVVRVNDLRIAEVSDVYKVIAVDIGFTGLLRRLGVYTAAQRISKGFGLRIYDNLVMWDNVEPVAGQIDNISLSVSYKKLKTLHPADIADILEDLDVHDRNHIFKTFDARLAADTLEELEDEYQSDLVESIDENRAREIFEIMPTDEIVDILEDIDEEHVDKILKRMDIDDALEIKELLDYDEDEVGSIMSKEFMSFNMEQTVDETIRDLRYSKPSSEIAYYLYAVDEESRLSGVVSLRDLIVSPPNLKLKDIMNKNIIAVKDMDSLDDLTELVVKYDLLAIPVVDEENVLIGITILNDIVDEILMPRWKRLLKRAI